MVDLTILNEIASIQAHVDYLNTYSFILQVIAVILVVSIIVLVGITIVSVKLERGWAYDEGELVILIILAMIIGIILVEACYLWYTCVDIPILETQIENLKAMAGI